MDRFGFIGILREKLRDIDMILERLSTSGEIYRIDTDLVLSKIRDLYEEVHQFAAIPVSEEMSDFTEVAAATVPVVDLAETVSMDPEPPPGSPEPETVSADPDKKVSGPEVLPEIPKFVPPVEEILVSGSEFEPEPLLEFLAPASDALPQENLTNSVLQGGDQKEDLANSVLQGGDQQPATRSEAEIPAKAGTFELRPSVHESKPVFQEPAYLKARPQEPPARPVQTDLPLFQREGSLNEALARQKPKQDIASAYNETPISDIWSAIAINDRFLFTRELFGNNSELFRSTVSILNGLSSWEAAADYITERFTWNTDDQVVRNFQNLVRRRFLK